MGHQEKKDDESRIKASDSRSSSRKRGSPLSRRESSPRSSSMRNKSVSPGGSSAFKERYSRFQEQVGDLFTAPLSHSLAHCVSSDMKMSAGIAVHFRKKFGHVEDLLSQGKRVGEVAHLKEGNRYIFYLVTKNRFHDRPTEDSLQKSLVEMKHLCHKLEVKKLAMPRIGCGLDGLVWQSVSAIIQKVFAGSGISITIYSVERGTPWSKSPASRLNRELPFFAKSEPLMRRYEDGNRKRVGSPEESWSTPKRRNVERPSLKLSLSAKPTVNSKTSSSLLKKSLGKSQWEASSSSSDESEPKNSAVKQSTQRNQKTRLSSSSDDNNSSKRLSRVPPKQKFSVSPPKQKFSLAKSYSLSSDEDESGEKSFELPTRKLESQVRKAVKVLDTPAGSHVKQTTSKRFDTKTKNVTDWESSSDNESPPNKKERKCSSSDEEDSSKKILLSKLSNSFSSKKPISSVSSLQYSPTEKDVFNQIHSANGSIELTSNRNKRKCIDFSPHVQDNDQEDLIDERPPLKSKKMELETADHQPLSKRFITKHVDYDFLSASDMESDEDLTEHQISEDDKPSVKHNNRIFIMTSPQRSPKKGLSSSLKERLGLPVTNIKRFCEYEEEEVAPTLSKRTNPNNIKARKSLPPMRGTMYSDREVSKVSVKDRLSLGSKPWQ